jgi:sterol desaturase/sphingolipid hydroxylase (fatty acid hydroxylase superfamily)
MSQVKRGMRDKFGDWRPSELIETPPIFVWPPKPMRFLKWFFGFPGYLWPWNFVYAAIAVLTWMFLTPDFDRMKTLEAGWIAVVFFRNSALLFVVVGLWHLRLYMQKAQGTEYKYSNRWLATDNPYFMFRSQLLENVFWTYVSAVPIWTAYEVVTLWGQANGWLPYVDLQANPLYCAALFLLIPFMSEVHFYLIHRLIHWPPLYRAVHHIHHKNVNPGPWSGLSMHPLEHVIYFSSVLIHWIIPSHPLHVIFNLQYHSITPAQGHLGFNQVVLKDGSAIETGDYYHYLHHKYFEVNYANDGKVPLDKWFGTFHDGSDEAEEAMDRRLRK